jgi:hypothetical protein
MNVLIFVRFDRNLKNRYEYLIKKHFDVILEVWTDENEVSRREDLYPFYEFSGYQEGVRRLIQKLASSKADVLEITESRLPFLRIMFINDTVINGHLNQLVKFVITQACGLLPDGSKKTVTGIVSKFQPARHSFGTDGSYLSTWFLTLIVETQDLSKIRFYPDDFKNVNFLAIWTDLPKEYTEKVDLWLQPENFFRGWYKSSPAFKLNPQTLNRKRLTIFLEHSQISRFKNADFECMHLSILLPWFSRNILFLLLNLDRLYVNWLKVRIRIAMKYKSYSASV